MGSELRRTPLICRFCATLSRSASWIRACQQIPLNTALPVLTVAQDGGASLLGPHASQADGALVPYNVPYAPMSPKGARGHQRCLDFPPRVHSTSQQAFSLRACFRLLTSLLRLRVSCPTCAGG